MNFRNIIIITISALVPIVGMEGYLRFDGRYLDQAQQKITPTPLVWDRLPDTIEYRKHPDLEYWIEIKFDKLGARNNQLIQKSQNVGFFGDSFTENRRIKNKFTFIEILNRLSGQTNFYNFGVDGYGIEQSFLKWKGKSEITNFNHVIYVFCANDLRNTYELQILDRKKLADGVVDVLKPPEQPIFISIMANFHVTYLAIEAWYKLKGRLVSRDIFRHKLVNKFTKQRSEASERFHDNFASQMDIEIINEDLSYETAKTKRDFINILETWQKAVLKKNSRFSVVVAPRRIDQELAKRLIPKGIDKITLIEDEKHRNIYFKNDQHWNEFGNIMAANQLKEILLSDYSPATWQKLESQLTTDALMLYGDNSD